MTSSLCFLVVQSLAVVKTFAQAKPILPITGNPAIQDSDSLLSGPYV
jgi:hypothetical protein